MLKDWKEYPGNEISDLITKGASPRWQGFEYQSTGCVFITSENVRDGYLDVESPKYLPIEFHKKQRNSQLRKDDILINIVGASIGRVCVYDGRFENANVNQAVCVFRPSAKIVPEFLSYYFQAPHVQRILLGSKSDSARPNLSLTDFRDFTFLLPPLPEQRKIAAILRTWDEGIEKTGSLIKQKQSFLSWFRGNVCTGKVRIKKFNRPWKKCLAQSVLFEHRDRSTGQERVHSVSVHKGVVDQIEHLGRSFAAQDTSKYNCVHFGDIIYTKSPTGDFPWGIIKQSQQENDVIVSPLYGIFRPETYELGLLLDFFFESEKYTRNYLHSLIQKGAKNTINITNSRFLDGEFFIPTDQKEIEEIAKAISKFRYEIQVINKIKSMMVTQKRGLMQKLLTGKWRVKA